MQKIIKVGSSAAVTIPKKYMERLNLKIGDKVNVETGVKSGTLQIDPVHQVDSKTIEWTRKFIDRYRDDLEELARR